MRDSRYLIELSETEMNTLTGILSDAEDKSNCKLASLKNVVQKASEIGRRGGSISFPPVAYSDIGMVSEIMGLSVSRTVETLINDFLDKGHKV